MDEEEDDDIYAPDDVIEVSEPANLPTIETAKKRKDLEEGEEEGEEVEEDESDSVYEARKLSLVHSLYHIAGHRHNH